jgi:RloB-like protein
MMARRGSESLGRRGPRRERKPRILIYCEGTRTEPAYFVGLVRHMRTALVDVVRCDVKGVGCDPLTVVRRAEQKWADDKRRTGGETYDQVWCVVDHDDHATLDAAIARASKAGIHLVVSTPCFDYWVLLHYVDHRKSSSAKDIERKLDKHIPGYDKKLPDSFPFDRYADAVRRAEGAAPSSNAIGPNPSTAVHLVVTAMGETTR